MPLPANRCATSSRISAQRIATHSSPSSSRSVQPTAPAYQPRSMPSSAGISRAASSRGSPPTAGVGCSRPASSSTGSGSASWARIGVPRCCTLCTFTSTGRSATVTHTLTGSSVRSIRRATIACSARFFALVRSCSPRWSSTAGSALRRVVPASATVCARAPSRRTSSSGLAPTNARLRRPDAVRVAGREHLAERPEDRARVVRAAAVDAHDPREHDLLELAVARSARRPGAPPPRSARAAPRSRHAARATGSGSISGIVGRAHLLEPREGRGGIADRA